MITFRVIRQTAVSRNWRNVYIYKNYNYKGGKKWKSQ